MYLLKSISVLLLFGLLGCRSVAIKGGHLPHKYLPEAKQFAGKYIGVFEGKKAEMTLYLRGDQPIVRYSDSTSNDILHVDCQSSIGLLKSIQIGNHSGREAIGTLEFYFNPGRCSQIQGRRLHLRFISKSKFEARILKYMDKEEECDPRFPAPREGDNCGVRKIPVYLEGMFTKYR